MVTPSLPNTNNPRPDYNYQSYLNGVPNQGVGADIDPRLIMPNQYRDQIAGGGNGLMSFNFGGTGNGTGDPITVNPSLQSVNPNQTVAYHLNNLTDSDSRYMRLADRDGRQIASRRGLMNSSIMADASRGAAIDRAMPIAGADSARYGRVGDLNQQAEMEARTTNANIAGQLRSAGISRSGAITGAMISNAGALDRMRVGADLEGIADLRRHMLGQEVREDQQAFQGGQADIDRALQDRRFWAQFGGSPMDWANIDQNQQRIDQAGRQLDHGINFDWARYQGSPLDWANLNAQTYINAQGPIWQSVAQIYSNPNISASEQQAAVRNLLGFVPEFNNQVWGAIPPDVINPRARSAGMFLPPLPRMNIGG